MFIKEIFFNEISYVFLKENYLGSDCLTLYKIFNFRYLDWDKCDYSKIDKFFIARIYLDNYSNIDNLIDKLTNKYIKSK